MPGVAIVLVVVTAVFEIRKEHYEVTLDARVTAACYRIIALTYTQCSLKLWSGCSLIISIVVYLRAHMEM